jgi:hypothetical protein
VAAVLDIELVPGSLKCSDRFAARTTGSFISP